MDTIDKLIDTAELEKALRELGQDVAAGYASTLLRNDHKATGELIDSIRATVDVDGAVYEVNLHMADYWKYLEEGTRPHWPPRDAILRWIEAKPVIPRPGPDGRIPSPESLAFLISRKISREGTKGTHDLEKTTDAIIPYWKERLRDILGRMWGDYIAKVISFPTK